MPSETEMDELDEVELTEEEKAMVAANEKAGLGTKLACHFCGMQFDVKKTRSLRAHIEEVHVVGDSGYMCGICCEEFISRKAVENHMSTLHRAPRPLGCGICGETFRLRSFLVKHMDSHSKDELENKKAGYYYCGECFEFFEDVALLQNHVVTHKETPVFVCAACGLQTHYRHILVKHLETHVISNLLTASDNKEKHDTETEIPPNVDFPQPVQIDIGRINPNDTKVEESVPQINNTDTNANTDTFDNVNGFVHNGETNVNAAAGVVGEEEANYKCGICDAIFTNLADALTHAGTHQSEDSSSQVEINIMMEDTAESVAASGLNVKTEPN